MTHRGTDGQAGRAGAWGGWAAAVLALALSTVPAGAELLGADPRPASVPDLLVPAPAGVPLSSYQKAMAEAVAGNEALTAFYAARDYAPLWTGPQDAARRQAALVAFSHAPDHGLPAMRYPAATLAARFAEVMGERDRALLEAEMSRAYLGYGRDVNSGALEPGRVDAGIVRKVARPDPAWLFEGVAGADPAGFLAQLPPHSAEYAALMAEKVRLEARGAGGPVIGTATLRPGQSGAPVAALRARLAALGHPSGEGAVYDEALVGAVRDFQRARGLSRDGIAGPGTLAALGPEPADHLAAVLVALERERWTNFDRGRRHVWVNLTEFRVRIVDDGEVTFETRGVIGKNIPDQRTPEFSDTMRFMVVNPSWHVPRSITTKEYLPMLQKNPNAVSHIQVVDRAGRVVDRAQVDFTQFSTSSFPFSMRQTPGATNALGRVKFMFPNKWNIYLHDTPSKSLFSNDTRAYSHGCIRLNDPFDFAYALLARQQDDPKAYFKRVLDTGRETTVMLKQPVPIHLDYRTAFTDGAGHIVYRPDVYGRDGRIHDALIKAGVAAAGVQG